MRDVNQETITGTLSRYRILVLNGFNLIRAKQRLHRRGKRVYESSSSRHKSQKLCLHNSVEFGKHGEDLSWNQRTSTPHRSETNDIAERAVRRVKEGTSAVLPQSGLDEKWWSDSLECHCCLQNVQDLQGDGKTPYERRFEEPFKVPMIPCGAMVEYHPISVRDLSKPHQLGTKVFPGIFLWVCVDRGKIRNRRHSDCGDWGIGKDGRTRNSSPKNHRERSIHISKRRRIHILRCRWYFKFVRKRPRIPSTHSTAGTYRKEWRWSGYFAKIQKRHCGAYSQWRSVYKRGGTSVRSRSQSVRNRATTRRNTCCSIAWKTLRRPRKIPRVGQRLKTTVDHRGEGNCMQNG